MFSAAALATRLTDARTVGRTFTALPPATRPSAYYLSKTTAGEIIIVPDVGQPRPAGAEYLAPGDVQLRARQLRRAQPGAKIQTDPQTALDLGLSEALRGTPYRISEAQGFPVLALRRPAPSPGQPAGFRSRPRVAEAITTPGAPRRARTPRRPREPRFPRRPRAARPPRPARKPRPPRRARPPRPKGLGKAFAKPYCTTVYVGVLDAFLPHICQNYEADAWASQRARDPKRFVIPADTPGCEACAGPLCKGPFAPFLQKVLDYFIPAKPVAPKPPEAGLKELLARRAQVQYARAVAAGLPAAPPTPPRPVRPPTGAATWVLVYKDDQSDVTRSSSGFIRLANPLDPNIICPRGVILGRATEWIVRVEEPTAVGAPTSCT